MKAIITNKITIIKNPSELIIQSLNDLMSFEDKAIKYQLKRIERNPFQRNSGYHKKLQKELNKSMLKRMDGAIAFNSGLAYLLPKGIEIEDRRTDTGTIIALPWAKKPFDLRDYQEEAVSKMIDNYRGVVNAATGLGKTLISIHLIKRLKKKTLIVVPSNSIAQQFYEQLSEAFGEKQVGFFGGGKKKIADITVGIAASVIKSTDKFKDADLGCIIFDEVHHIAANTFFDIAKDLGDIGRIYGLTATDYRSDGKDIMINAGCGGVILKRDAAWGIKKGFLAKPSFIIKKIETTGIDYKADKLKSYKEHVLNNQKMKDQILSDLQLYLSQGKSVLCLVDEVAHGEELSRLTGLPFAQGSDKKSQSYVDELNSGKISGLIGTDGRIGEGTDTKNVDVLIMANFVASKGPVIQAIGRGLRISGTKNTCLVLDYIPLGSSMMTRHAEGRIKIYKELSFDIKIE